MERWNFEIFFSQVEEMGQKKFQFNFKVFLRIGRRGTAEIDANPLFASRD